MDKNMMWVETLWNPLNEKKKSLMDDKQSLIRVAAYCRVSPGRDTYVHSLINQINHFTFFIRSKPNWKFSGIYYDKGVSATNINNRSGLKRLLRHAKEGHIDYIITKSVSRFSRNSKELLEIVNELKEINVGIYFEKENIDTLIGFNEFLISTYGALSQQEAENISFATKWGFEKKFAKGIIQFGNLMGYRVTYNNGIPDVLVIEEEAALIREMFNKYLDGETLTEIAREMMKREIKTTRGGELWTSARIKNILTNLTYTGNKLTNEQTKDLLTRSQDNLTNQYIIEQSNPAIIDMETFNLVQIRIEQVNPKKGKRTTEYTVRPLSQRITCGLCGRKYLSHPKKGRCSWECRTHIVYKELCSAKTLNEQVIRNMLLKAFEERFDFGEENILYKLLKIIKTVNRNDHFEFHRLKYLTDIELAIKLQQPDVEKMEEEFKLFEEKITKIEDDRKYRDLAIEWMEKVKSINEFIESVTIEYMRAWIIDIILYSKEDYVINWVDDVQLEMGDISKYKIQAAEKKADKIKIDAKPPDHNREEYDLRATADVIKIEPENHLVMIKDIKKNLNKFKLKNEYIIDKPKIRTASYCRVSTDSDEQQTSLKTQVAYYTYLILKNPKYEFVGIYADDGITGTSAKSRKEFLRLIKDCKAGKIDLILTKSISRFARNTLDCLKYIKELKECGTDIYFEKENINTADDKSHFLVSVIGSLAQEESVSSGSAIRWGKNILAQRGIVNPGTINYGYKYGKDNEWVVIKEEAEIVKRIYKKFLAGKSFGQIARELTKDKNAKSPAGNDAWSDRTIRAILTNEVYRGNFLYQKMYTKQTIDKVVLPNRGELPMYLIEDHHQAIVSSEDWEKVQEIHVERLKVIEESIKFRQPKENGKNEAFSKKLYCGECGGVISYKRGKTRYKKEINSWRCNTSAKSSDSEKCKAGFIKQEYVELNFMNMIMGIRGNNDFDEYLNNHISILELTKEEEVEEIEIKSRIEILNNMIYEAVDVELNKNGQDSRRIDELTGEIVRLRNRLKEFEERREQIGNIKVEVDWLFNQYLQEEYDESKTINYIPFYEYMFNRLIEKGIIYGDGKIVFIFKSGIEWSIPLRYEEYLVESQKTRVEDNRTKRLESDEVKALLEFCKKPRTKAEMLEFSSYKSMSGIERSVIKPLMEQGKLKRKRDENYRALQYLYYTVE